MTFLRVKFRVADCGAGGLPWVMHYRLAAHDYGGHANVEAYFRPCLREQGNVTMGSEKYLKACLHLASTGGVTKALSAANGKVSPFRRGHLAAIAVCAMLLVSIAACANSGSDAAVSPARAPTQSAVEIKPDAAEAAPFTGSWESCAGAESPDQCSLYLLLQRGKKICGTWSYFASGDGYEGRVIANAASPIEARRIRICGRPGSETRVACETGWEAIDRPLRLCGGKLGDMDGKNGTCFADFERIKSAGPSLAALAEQPWIKACLSNKEEGDGA